MTERPNSRRCLLPSCPQAPGSRGSLGFTDPEAELGFGYVMNQMALGAIGDQRAYRFVEAVYASLE